VEELKNLLSEISTKAADRQNAMRRLVGSLAPQSRLETGQALSDYQQQLTIWNATLSSFYVRIRLAADYAEAIRFERDVHTCFVDAGRSIEQVLRSRADGVKPNWSDLIEPKEKLNILQARLFAFLRDLADEIERRREEIYFGRKLKLALENLGEYTTLELLKALFTVDVDSLYVIRPA
jgi:hypothetical protein